MDHVDEETAPSIKWLLQGSVPAIIVGVVSAICLLFVDKTAHILEKILWEHVPELLRIPPDSGWWIFGALTLTGFAVGLVVTFFPGNGGPDTATVDLIAPPIRLSAVPGLALVTVLGLAGGVSLGPESAIVAVNTALMVAAGNRFWPQLGVPLTVMMSVAGTIGALFGTPVAAILVLTGVVAAAKSGGVLWDRLFLPLVAASAASMTLLFVGGQLLRAPAMPLLDKPLLGLLPAAALIACLAALVGLLGSALFQPIHSGFRRLRWPLLYTTAGGMLLGLLGVLGGPTTLFKGSTQMVDLVERAGELTALQLVVIVLVKLFALLIAATSGFRGGRIFPAIFIGVAIGLLCHTLFPQIPMGLAIACGTLGTVPAVSRDGWIAIFIAVVVSGDIALLPLLCLLILPVWLLVARAPEMIAQEPPAVRHQPSTS